MLRRKKTSSILCNHQWKNKEVILIGGKYPRRIKVCKLCGEEIHQAIPSLKQIMEKEIKRIRGEDGD